MINHQVHNVTTLLLMCSLASEYSTHGLIDALRGTSRKGLAGSNWVSQYTKECNENSFQGIRSSTPGLLNETNLSSLSVQNKCLSNWKPLAEFLIVKEIDKGGACQI